VADLEALEGTLDVLSDPRRWPICEKLEVARQSGAILGTDQGGGDGALVSWMTIGCVGHPQPLDSWIGPLRHHLES